MKIVIATAVYYPQINGVAVFSHNLACGLVARGHEVLVICPSQSSKSYTEMQEGVKVCYLKSTDVKVYPDQIHTVPERRKIAGVGLPRVFYRHGLRASIFPKSEVTRILNDFKPEVVHVQVSDPIGLSVVGWARRHGVPVVTTEHNQPEVLTDSLKLPRVLKRGANAVLSAYFRNRQSKSDFVTMPTERAIRGLLGSRLNVKGLMRRDGSVVPVAAVSNGVDLVHFKSGRAPAEVYKKYGLNKDRLTVLYVGRLDPEKKVDEVIRAFKQAQKSLTGVQLVIAGDGVDRARFEKMAAGCKDIHFLGRVMPPELYKVYQLGDVFATASPIETQGIVLIEAAACGVPLIAVDKGAVSEVCQDGVNGVLCAAGDESALAAAMVNILSDARGRKRMAAESLKIAHEHDLERTLDRFEHIYRRVVQTIKL